MSTHESRYASLQVRPVDALELQLMSTLQNQLPWRKQRILSVDSMLLYPPEGSVLSRLHFQISISQPGSDNPNPPTQVDGQVDLATLGELLWLMTVLYGMQGLT